MKSIIILSLLALSLCGFGNNMGAWQKDTFESNDMRIDRARSTAEDDFKAKSNLKDDEAEIYEIAVYHQLVLETQAPTLLTYTTTLYIPDHSDLNQTDSTKF